MNSLTKECLNNITHNCNSVAQGSSGEKFCFKYY